MQHCFSLSLLLKKTLFQVVSYWIYSNTHVHNATFESISSYGQYQQTIHTCIIHCIFCRLSNKSKCQTEIDGLVQEGRNSSAIAIELRISCNPSKCFHHVLHIIQTCAVAHLQLNCVYHILSKRYKKYILYTNYSMLQHIPRCCSLFTKR